MEDNDALGKGESYQKFQALLKARVKKFCQMNYNSVKKTETRPKTDTVCMRENPFYVDTVRDFRDRRYEFKRLVKVWLGKLKEPKEAGNQ